MGHSEPGRPQARHRRQRRYDCLGLGSGSGRRPSGHFRPSLVYPAATQTTPEPRPLGFRFPLHTGSGNLLDCGPPSPWAALPSTASPTPIPPPLSARKPATGGMVLTTNHTNSRKTSSRTERDVVKAPPGAIDENLCSLCPLWFKFRRPAANTTAFTIPSRGEGFCSRRFA